MTGSYALKLGTFLLTSFLLTGSASAEDHQKYLYQFPHYDLSGATFSENGKIAYIYGAVHKEDTTKAQPSTPNNVNQYQKAVANNPYAEGSLTPEDREGHLLIFDVANSQEIKLLSDFNLGHVTPYGDKMRNGRLFLFANTGSYNMYKAKYAVLVLDLTNPGNPKLAATLPGTIKFLSEDGKTIETWDYMGLGEVRYDIADPYHPVSMSTPPSGPARIGGMAAGMGKNLEEVVRAKDFLSMMCGYGACGQ